MVKRLVAIILAAVAALALCGCDGIIESDYTSVNKHEKSTPPDAVPEGPVKEVSDYLQLREAIAGFVEERAERGTVRLIGYERDVEKDVVDACMEVANNTPMGSYAVYYITSNLSKIVSYYEAEILITYNRSADEMKGVITVKDKDIAREALAKAMDTYAKSLAMLIDVNYINEGFIASCVDELYYSDPSLSVTYPEATVSSYPQTRENRIIEVKFSYTYLKSSLVGMQEKLLTSADELVKGAGDFGGVDALLYITEELSNTVKVKEKNWDGSKQDAWNTDDTAYGALVRGEATSEGFSMAAKLVCDRLGIECLVVHGRRNGTDYNWNIVQIDDEYYHIDMSRCASEGIGAGFLKNDSEMTDEYLWDVEKYPKCDGSLSTGDFVSINISAEALPVEPTAR